MKEKEIMEIRLECLQLASELGIKDEKKVLKIAEEYFKFVMGEDKPKK